MLGWHGMIARGGLGQRYGDVAAGYTTSREYRADCCGKEVGRYCRGSEYAQFAIHTRRLTSEAFK